MQGERREDTVKKITFTVLVFIGICVFGSPRLAAQETPSQPADPAGSNGDESFENQVAQLRNNIRWTTKKLVAANLTLTDSEAAKFWPVYEQYSADREKINNTRIALIEEYAHRYGALTDDQADRFIRSWLDADTSAAELRQKYVPIFREVLPGKKAATFFQLDRLISMMVDVQLTSQLPLLQSQDQGNGDQNKKRL
jgi:hypothetical protein